jgi:serine/threonine-protein kinase
VAGQTSPSTAVGTLLNGTYRLERVVAEGGMGVVYEAGHVRLPRRFAVKILAKPIDKESAPTLQRFRREADIASTLAHPHIVEVFDYQVSEYGAPYLVMELLEGEDLADRLKRGRLSIVTALRIIDEIAQALDVAHTAGVVHRDLKPANIFLSRRAGRDDFVKVLDFGVSKLIDSATLTQEKAMVGTPLYMSPEQAVGTQELTPESDIFSLGAISYEMLAGRRAFAASSIPSILYQIVHGPTPKLAGKAPGLSVAVDEVFARVLAKKKHERYRRASQFAEDLRLALSREEVPSLASQSLLALGEDALAELAAVGQGRDNEPQPGELTGMGRDTEVDSSTKAEEALVVAARSTATSAGPRPRTPSVQSILLAPPQGLPPPAPAADFDRSYTDLLTSGPRRSTVMLLIAALLASAAGVVAVVLWGDRIALWLRPPAPPMVAATPPATTTPAEPVAAPTTPPPVTQPAVAEAPRPRATEFEPEPISKHVPVQFVFHVWPRGAEIFVDDRKVEGGHLTLPYQAQPHRVNVRAPGYHALAMNAPSTANRTFELRMDRIVVRAKKPAPPRPAHDAAPVQDL